jgi:hypothetical protein
VVVDVVVVDVVVVEVVVVDVVDAALTVVVVDEASGCISCSIKPMHPTVTRIIVNKTSVFSISPKT